ncbi:hypothetical protein ACLESD_20290 [Pyxidicoccus sp. 3LFB2]
MLKHLLSSSCALMLVGCGGALPSGGGQGAATVETVAQAAACADCDTTTESADVPGTHGYEIELPIWNLAYVPADWEVYAPETIGPMIRPRSGAVVATMNWGGGNALYNIKETHMPHLDVRIEMGTGYQVIGHISGYFQNTQPGKVRGSLEMEMETFSAYSPAHVTDDIVLALQTYNGVAWTDAAVRNMRLTEWYYGEVEALLPPNVDVRFEIRVRRRTDSRRYFAIVKSRMFGAQCYPDFANAGSCL